MADIDSEEINRILETVGVPGRYQMFIFSWTFLICIISQSVTLMVPFSQADMNFRCNQSDFPIEVTNFSSIEDNEIPSCYTNTTVPVCQEFVYEQEIFTNTVVSQFNLVCSRAFLVILANMLYMGMGIPAGMTCGVITDRWGRKKATVLYLSWIGIASLASSFSVNMTMYIVLRCLTAFPSGAVWDSTSALLSEITSPNRRPHVLIGNTFAWTVSIWLATLLSYFIRDWRYLTMALSVPSIILALLLIWVFDESPHWLYSKGRYIEAQQVINKMVRWNKISPDESHEIKAIQGDTSRTSHTKEKMVQASEETDVESQAGCIDIFKSPPSLKIILICAFGWMACNLGYGGLFLGIAELGGDIFVNSVIGGAVEVLAYASCFLIMSQGRKNIFILLQIIGGVALISSAFVVSYLPGVVWAIITLTMLGRLCISAAWQVLYVWSLELFPTSVRVFMVQATMLSGRIGSTIGPLIKDLKKIITNEAIREEMIAPCLYGSLLLVAGLLALYLPETNNKPLPVTIEQAIAIHSKRKGKPRNNSLTGNENTKL